MRKHPILMLALAAGIAAPQLGAAQSQDTRPGIAVLPFENGGSYGQDAEVFDALRVGMQQMIMTELSMNDGARVVDRSALNELLAEQDLGASGRVDPNTAARIGRLVGAKFVVAGNFIDFYGDMRIDARIVDVETSEIVNVARVRDKREDMYRLVVDLGVEIMDDVSLPPLSAQAREARASRQIPQEAMTLYSRAIYYQDRGNTDRAVELLRQVQQEFPQMTEAPQMLRQLGRS